MWFDVDPRTDTKKPCAWKRLDCGLQNMITILGSLVNIIGRTYITSTRIFTLIMNKTFINISS